MSDSNISFDYYQDIYSILNSNLILKPINYYNKIKYIRNEINEINNFYIDKKFSHILKEDKLKYLYSELDKYHYLNNITQFYINNKNNLKQHDYFDMHGIDKNGVLCILDVMFYFIKDLKKKCISIISGKGELTLYRVIKKFLNNHQFNYTINNYKFIVKL